VSFSLNGNFISVVFEGKIVLKRKQ